MSSRVRVAVVFGGRSVEHEISVISALQLLQAIDPARYEAIPVYISPAGGWYVGRELLDRNFYKRGAEGLRTLQEVTLLPKPGIGGLTKVGNTVDLAKQALSLQQQIIPVDVIIPAFHGQCGEDGCFQGLCELAQIPYSGSNVPSSSITMNKYLCKMFLKAHDIPVLPAVIVPRARAKADLEGTCTWVQTHKGFEKFPVFVKPCSLGSSIGASRASNRQELAASLAQVFRYDTVAIIEPCISDLMEINVAIRDHNGVHASCVEIPVSDSGVLSYEEKYLREGGKKSGPSQGMASLTRVIDPPDLDEELRSKVIEYGKRSFELLGCSGAARIDFIVDISTGELFFNELNAFPGSLSFYLWVRSKPRVLYTDLISDMIETALANFAEQARLNRDIGLKALA